MQIRLATPEDSKALLKIYTQYIDTPITFECTLPSIQEFAQRIQNISKEYPYLVCEEKDRIVAYAYAHRHMEREAYQWNAELSVYLDATTISQGLGKKLYTILIDLLNLQNIKTVYGGITVPNQSSEGLHLSMGFHCIGTYHNAGYKNGAWHDVSWFEKEIAPYTTEPKPFLPISKIPFEQIQAIIKVHICPCLE